MKKLTSQQALEKLQRYCAFQERTHQEVRQKLFQLGVYGDQAEELLTNLITSGFLNEERFAKAFAGGKFRMKKWGRLKIINALEAKGISNYCIKSGLKEIDVEDYEQTLRNLLLEKGADLREENIFVKRDKLSKYAIQKGYEPDLTWTLIRELFPDRKK